MTGREQMVTTDATPATLEAIWREFSQDLHAFIARRVPSPEDADDILQVVFVRIADGLSGLRDDTRLLGWMYALTRNAITDHYRSAVHRREIATDAVPDVLTSGPLDDDDDDAALREFASCLRPMLTRLPDDQAAAVRMIDLDGEAQAAAARAAGITLSGMKSRVQRGRARLHQLLLDCCEISQDARGRIQEYSPRASRCDCTRAP
jgi:RNA polymerase sigma-70 factor (ECF subfamily)